MTETPRSALARNPVSLAGAAIATLSAVFFLIVFFVDLLGFHTNPYIGIIFFLVTPTLFVLGLALIPIGLAIERRRRIRGRAPMHWPRLDLNEPADRGRVALFLALTLVNVIVVSLAAYRGVEYMDSVAFCGQVCHEVMKPEFVAYQDGPHSRVACVECHIGPGAPWFVRSKLSGTRQAFAVLLNTHDRPIPSPVENLRPARDTCEQCHWPEKFHGDKLVTRREYAADEANTETVTKIAVHVGGGSEKLGTASGIHWHMNIANQIDYIATDDKRQVIPYVRLRDRHGREREFVAEGVTPEQLAKGERRRMDCMDCHNRPSHPFAGSADRAVDEAMARGEMPKTLPYAKREAVAALKAAYPAGGESDAIAARLREFYGTSYNDVFMTKRQDVERVVNATARLYGRNVFSEMKVTWGTYANNIGHMDFPGCFRCHDDSHKSKDGSVIRQDCELCHTIE